ncbi:SipW-dependent-type signal peptide-containing protein [Paeniglutamicibacter sp. MACA_103]|uniref:SipW-dependent-type signal peptide-containing protein n=1 Tax=Paeniglutamicibacter sp. MACA_103 TaxID=3377337 RepID=UPI00389456C1
MSQKEKNRKVRAILAGGLVLGVGAAVTLAAWNDSEFAQGTFGAGHFNMQGSTNGTDFSDHAAGAPAQLGFSLGFDGLSPTDTVAAPFVMHLDPDTTNNAEVSVASATVSGTAALELSYGIVQVDSFASCTPTATGTQIVPAGTPLDSVTGASPFTLAKSTAPGTDPGADVFLCLQVTASSTIAQDTTAVGTWEFVGTSTP